MYKKRIFIGSLVAMVCITRCPVNAMEKTQIEDDTSYEKILLQMENHRTELLSAMLSQNNYKVEKLLENNDLYGLYHKYENGICSGGCQKNNQKQCLFTCEGFTIPAIALLLNGLNDTLLLKFFTKEPIRMSKTIDTVVLYGYQSPQIWGEILRIKNVPLFALAVICNRREIVDFFLKNQTQESCGAREEFTLDIFNQEKQCFDSATLNLREQMQRLSNNKIDKNIIMMIERKICY